ncbi:MAG: efflux RND transporter permease subunit [Candidatus Wallbacteria bacterium]|nr:efflux RND transporter permease subunit [Candidatus Wallbacteria bacterium]
MSLAGISVKRPVGVTVFYLIVLILGSICLYKLPIDMFPSLDVPSLSVITIYPGANAQDVENNVTRYIEEKLASVNNLNHITSKSKDNVSMITCQFEWGTNLDEAANDIRQQLEMAKTNLPEDAEKSVVYKFSTSSLPILLISLSTDHYPEDLYFTADKIIGRELKKLPGVGACTVEGFRKREIRIEVDPERLRFYGLSLDQISQMTALSNLDVPAGTLNSGKYSYNLRLAGRIENLKELKRVILAERDGKAVYLEDVAKIYDGFEEKTALSRGGSGKPSLILFVQKQSGANTVTVVDAVMKRIAELKTRLPAGTEIDVVSDNSKSIRNSINTLSEAVLLGAFLVALVTFLFLRQISASLIIMVTLPVSLIWAFVVLYLSGSTINLISLMSISIVIGMMVDDAVVVLENIQRHMESGESREFSSIYGTWEVWAAVLASALTTAVVFFPLFFVGGISAIFFKELALIVGFTIMASWLTSVTLTPMLTSRFMTLPTGDFYQKTEKWLKKMEDFYRGLIRSVLSRPKAFLTVMLLIFLGSLCLFPLLNSEFMPLVDQGEMQIQADLDAGTRLEETDRYSVLVADIIREVAPEVKAMAIRYGQSKDAKGAIVGMKEGKESFICYASLVEKSKRKRSVQEVGKAIGDELKKRCPAFSSVTVNAGDLLMLLLFGGAKPVTVELYGPDFNELTTAAESVFEMMKKVPGTSSVVKSFDPPRPELVVRLNRELAQRKKVNPALAGKTIRDFFYGKKVSIFREQGEEFDIFLTLPEAAKEDLDSLKKIYITSMSGELVPLSEVAQIEFAAAPTEIMRKDQEKMVRVMSGTYGRPLSAVLTDVKSGMAKLNLPATIRINYSGDVEEQKKSFTDLSMLLIVGIILVYLVMAGQFESFKIPFLIMFSLPFTLSGVIIALLITGTTLNIMSFFGIIMLVGVVVKNAIVLVDYIGFMRKRGVKLKEAIVETGARRLRPILITSLATICGMLPLALGHGDSSEVFNPIGITMIGGLLVSTVTTLLIIPGIYYVTEKEEK